MLPQENEIVVSDILLTVHIYLWNIGQFGAYVGHYLWLSSDAVKETPGGVGWLCVYLEGFSQVMLFSFAFHIFFFRCATTSQRALLYGNQIERGKGPPLKIKLENLSLCMRFTANSSWSTHPKPEHIHVLELWFWYFLSL